MPSLVPAEYWQYSASDMVLGLLTALSFRKDGGESSICIPKVGQCLPVRSGRAAIYLALRALGLPAGARVGVPLYCCPIVLKAIDAAGCRPRFIDIDPGTYCLSVTDLAAKSSEVDAVLAVHMFGNVCDIRCLREAAPGKPVIEDCAQALGSRLDGRAAGTFGEVAVFSFRSGKYLSVGEGGAVYSSQAAVHAELSAQIAALPGTSHWHECVHVVSTYLRSALRSKPLWGLAGARLWDAYTANTSYTAQAPLVVGRVYATDREMAVRRLSVVPDCIERQRATADYYSRHLSVDAGMLCPETPGAFFNRLQYPLLIPTPLQCSRLAASLRENGITTARPYKDIPKIAETYYGYAGDCPQAERAASNVLVIPCNHALKPADVKRITRCVNRAWAEIGIRQTSSDTQATAKSTRDYMDASRRRGNFEGAAEPHHFS